MKVGGGGGRGGGGRARLIDKPPKNGYGYVILSKKVPMPIH